MLSRQAVSRLARPLVRLSSSTSVVSPPVEPKQVAPQAPNYATTWTTSQAPRPQGQSGPRFEQTAMELQPNPLSAMQMVAEEPIRVVHGRKAVCDGGALPRSHVCTNYAQDVCCLGVGPLGHPKIFINLVRRLACPPCVLALHFNRTSQVRKHAGMSCHTSLAQVLNACHSIQWLQLLVCS